MQHEINDAEQRAFESRLRSLQPKTPALDRDQLMFRAGQRAVSRGNRLWPTLTIGSWIACAAAIAFLISRPAEVITKTRIVERVVRVPEVVDSSPEPRSTTAKTAIPDREADHAFASHGSDLWSLDEIDGPLTAGGWRNLRTEGLDNRLASAAPEQSRTIKPGRLSPPPKTYGELRRQLMNGNWNGSLNVGQAF